eukprot:6133457-Pleurochrysis_carterae.AAC.1
MDIHSGYSVQQHRSWEQWTYIAGTQCSSTAAHAVYTAQWLTPRTKRTQQLRPWQLLDWKKL